MRCHLTFRFLQNQNVLVNPAVKGVPVKLSLNANNHSATTVAARKLLLIAALALAITSPPATTAFAQTSNPADSGQQQQHPASNPGGEIRGSFPVTLSKSLDSKKLKDGDIVLCQTAAALHARSGFLVPSGSKVIGHVTQAQARSKGDQQSSLAMVFDKIEISKNETIPITGTLQAIAPTLGASGPDTASMMGSGQMMPGRGGSSTMPPPSSGGVGPNSGIHPVDASGGPHPILIRDSQGVLGFKGMEMDKDHVITSTGKEIKLDSGTQMMIRAEVEEPAK